MKGKRVAYITVKNKDYIRTTQIKRLLEKEAAYFALFSSEKGNPLSRALDLRRRMKRMDLSGYDVVILGFLPQLLWGALPKKMTEGLGGDAVGEGIKQGAKGRPVIVSEFFLSVYDTVVLDRRLVEDGHYASMKCRELDRRAILGADLVLTDTRADADFFASLYGADRSKFDTLYLEADSEIYNGTGQDLQTVIDEIENAETTYASSDKLRDAGSVSTVLYFGTGLPLQGTDVVMEAFNQVAGDTNSRIRCVFIGKTRGIPKVELIKARKNPNIEIIHWLPQSALAEKIRHADLCIAGHFNLYIDKASRTIPGKAFIYEAMNKPMILGDTEANHELFSEDARHLFVPRGNAKALADAIRSF